MAETDLSDLKPAKENPWYILMTLHGEQKGDGVDRDLAEKNVRLWNIWSCQLLSYAECTELREGGAAVPDADAWDTNRAEIERRFADRIAEVDWDGREIPDLPGPKAMIDMSKTALSNTVVLDKAVFGQHASFDSATFTQHASFRSATFTQDAYFRSANFEDRAYFTATRFGDPEGAAEKPALLHLTDAQFDRPVSFREARFLNRFPDFTGAILHDKSLFEAEREYWPTHTDQNPVKGRDSCAFLRHHVGKQGLPEAEHFFYRREMAFATQIGDWWQRLPYRLFSLSGYGSSIRNPALWLLGLWLIPALIYTCVFAWCRIMHAKPFGVFEGFGFSFSNIFKFFGLQRVFFADTLDRIAAIPTLGPVLETLAAAQTVLGFIFLFFLGLGLRQRFRLR